MAAEKLSHHGDLEPKEEKRREDVKKGVRPRRGGGVFVCNGNRFLPAE